MAYRRCLLQRANNLIHRNSHSSFTYLLQIDDQRSFSTRSFGIQTSLNGFSSSSQHLSPFAAGYNHHFFSRNMSTFDSIIMKLNLPPMEGEAAIAAADSIFPVQAVQYLIDSVHSYTGLDWWLSIVLSTVLIRTATIPLLVLSMKISYVNELIWEKVMEQIYGKDPKAVIEGRERMKKPFKKYGMSPLTPLKELFIQGPIFISVSLAIVNMASKMPSFKHGGAFWFTDLTTPDSLFIFPALTVMSFFIRLESNMQEGMEGNPMGALLASANIITTLSVNFYNLEAGMQRNFKWALTLFTVPTIMIFPKAVFCYWITTNLFTLSCKTVLKVPAVKKALPIYLRYRTQ